MNKHSYKTSSRTLACAIVINTLLSANVTADRSGSRVSCGPGCLETVDYQSTDSPLRFSRTSHSALNAGVDDPVVWRHRYDIRLTSRGNDLVVFDHLHRRHTFIAQSDGQFIPAQQSSGSLEKVGSDFQWMDSEGVRYRFQGSYPVEIGFPDQQRLKLRYRTALLQSITDDSEQSITLDYQQRRLVSVRLPDGQAIDIPSSTCHEQQESLDGESPGTDEPVCDVEENPVPGFAASTARPGVSHIDARPASCQSYFVAFYGTERGAQIETALAALAPYSDMQATSRSFPIVDFIHGNELVVIRSRDLGSASFNDPADPDALFERLMRDGQQIQQRFVEPLAAAGTLSAGERGQTTTITHEPDQQYSLHLLIRHGIASAAQWAQIAHARAELAERYGFDLRVIVIP